MSAPTGMTRLVVAFILGAAAWSAMPPPAASATDEAQGLDKIRAKKAALAETMLAQQGGSRLLFKVDADALHDMVVTGLRDDLYRELREDRIPFSGLALHDGGVDVRIPDPNNRQKVVGRLIPPTTTTPPRQAAIRVTDSGDGLIRLTPTESGFDARLHELVGHSMDMIEQGVHNSGIELVATLPDGADRVRVLLPGTRDTAKLTAMFGDRARVAFRMIDVSTDATAALQGTPPAGAEVLYGFKTRDPYLVVKDVAISGDDIIDVVPGFDSATQQPIVTFRFNAHGTRRLTEISRDNIGRPFAIVIGDLVVSSAVIREPITGGSGQIAGNFTLQEANSIAMLMRSGMPTGRLSLVDTQIVQPAATVAKP